MLASAALPSSDGIAWIGNPGTMYELIGLPDSGNIFSPNLSK